MSNIQNSDPAQIAQNIAPMIWLDATGDQMQQLRYQMFAKQPDISQEKTSDYHKLDQFVLAIRDLRSLIVGGAAQHDIFEAQASILLALPFYLNLYVKNGGKFYDFEGQLVTT